MSYIPLHNHSEYSFFDGFSNPSEIAKQAKAIGASAVALTDHGTLNGAVRFVDACNKEGIRPILGSEVYWAPDATNKSYDERLNHLVLWATNEEGYKNLIKLVSLGHTEGEMKRGPSKYPCIDDNMLSLHAKGLAASSACISGRIPRLLLEGKIAEAEEKALFYRDLFEEFALEIQPHLIDEQYTVNYMIYRLSEKTGIPLIATTDSHYATKEEYSYQDLFLAIQTSKEINDPERFRMDDSPTYWIKDRKTLAESFKWNKGHGIEKMPKEIVEAAIDYTHVIADKCNVVVELHKNRMPSFPLPENEDPESVLIKKAQSGLFSRALEGNIQDFETYSNRLAYELEVIISKGYTGYFLIVADIVQTGKDKLNIPFGPGRGSAGGCLLSWVLRITDIDPIRFNLLFERFLNPERESPPDIDIDIPDDRRDELISYVKERYGEDHVAQISNNNTMGAKDAFKRVAKAYGIPFQKANSISKRIDSRNISEEIDSFAVEFFKANPEVFNGAVKMQDRAISKGMHAAGLVISPDPITYYTPFQIARDGSIVTQADMHDIEELGLLKVDLLSLKTLKVIDHGISLNKDPNLTWDTLYNIDLEDPKIYELIRQGRTEAVFQIESNLMKRLIQDIKPSEFEDLVAILALGRPGPAAMAGHYATRKHGMEPIHYMHPKLEPVLKNTYGIMVYQEQVIEAARVLAGYSLGQADLLRRAMGKKEEEVMDAEKSRFIEGCKTYSDIDNSLAEEIWDQIEQFAGYGFNRSHAVGYAVISAWTAYMKVYAPSAYWTAVLSNEVESNAKDRDQKIATYVAEARRDGVTFLPPDINKSDHYFKFEDGLIRWGLSGITGLGAKGVESILVNRPFNSFDSLLENTDRRCITKTTIRSLIFSGALEELEGKDRTKTWEKYLDWRTESKMPVSEKDHLERPCSRSFLISEEARILGVSVSQRSDWEKASSGSSLSIDGEVSDLRTHIDRNGNEMAFITFKTDQQDEISVVVFASSYKKYKNKLKPNSKLCIAGEKDKNGGFLFDSIADPDGGSDHGRSYVDESIILASKDVFLHAN